MPALLTAIALGIWVMAALMWSGKIERQPDRIIERYTERIVPMPYGAPKPKQVVSTPLKLHPDHK